MALNSAAAPRFGVSSDGLPTPANVAHIASPNATSVRTLGQASAHGQGKAKSKAITIVDPSAASRAAEKKTATPVTIVPKPQRSPEDIQKVREERSPEDIQRVREELRDKVSVMPEAIYRSRALAAPRLTTPASTIAAAILPVGSSSPVSANAVQMPVSTANASRISPQPSAGAQNTPGAVPPASPSPQDSVSSIPPASPRDPISGVSDADEFPVAKLPGIPSSRAMASSTPPATVLPTVPFPEASLGSFADTRAIQSARSSPAWSSQPSPHPSAVVQKTSLAASSAVSSAQVPARSGARVTVSTGKKFAWDFAQAVWDSIPESGVQPPLSSVNPFPWQSRPVVWELEPITGERASLFTKAIPMAITAGGTVVDTDSCAQAFT